MCEITQILKIHLHSNLKYDFDQGIISSNSTCREISQKVMYSTYYRRATYMWDYSIPKNTSALKFEIRFRLRYNIFKFNMSWNIPEGNVLNMLLPSHISVRLLNPKNTSGTQIWNTISTKGRMSSNSTCREISQKVMYSTYYRRAVYVWDYSILKIHLHSNLKYDFD